MPPTIKRFLRVLITVGSAGALSIYGSNPYYLAVAPVLSALGKWLREEDPHKWGWLPF